VVAPGWYQDPWNAAAQRYYDGRNWTERVRPAGAPTPTTQPKGGGKRLAGVIAVATFLLATAVVCYAMARGQNVKSVDTHGKIEFFDNGKEYSQDDIRKQQGNVQAQVDDAQEAAKRTASNTPAPPSTPNLAGTWQGGNGLTYGIAQYGIQLVIQEMTTWGITAVGRGMVDGARVSFAWQAFNGVTGTLDLTVAAGGRRMDGTITSAFAGSQPFLLSR
jgi:hypothetical protein